MSRSSGADSHRNFWNRLTGDPTGFSMENRAFNYVCAISFFLLLICLVFDIYIQQYLMSSVLVGLMALLAVMYYYSRYHKRYRTGITLYMLFSYAALILNFFVNEGINGPTLYMFFVTLVFLIALGKPRQYVMVMSAHVACFLVLLIIEYNFPQLVPRTYINRFDRFLDTGVTGIVVLVFIFAITNYLRNYYNAKRLLADERAQAIVHQNQQIIAQNRELERVNDEKNKLFSIVSHDLKAPLDSIKGYLELLSGNLLEEDDKNRLQEELQEQTKYTTDLLQNLMSWAKAQMHGVTVHLAPLNLRELVEQVAGNKKYVAARKGIKLTYSIDPSLEVVADKDMLHIVLRNLINNAIKFTRAGGEVLLKVAAKDGMATIAVADTGIGIPPEKQKELFTLKTRSTYGTNNEKGIGLGLMMCKEFMDYQHGEIWFESEEGKGSTFFISLPLTRL